MGWASGSELARKLITALVATISEPGERYCFYLNMIDAFEDQDCDTLFECMGNDPQFDSAMRFLHPGWNMEEE